MAVHQETAEKPNSAAQTGAVLEVEKPAGAHEEYVVDSEGNAVRIDYSGAHKKTDPEEIKYEDPFVHRMSLPWLIRQLDLSRSLIVGSCLLCG
jgi:hypothetical protein